MSEGAARRTVAGLIALVFVLEVAAVCLAVGEQSLAQPVLYLVYAVVQAGAGALVVHRFPRHRIGWILVLYADLNAVLADFCLAYGVRAAHEHWPLAHVCELLGLVAWIPAASGLVLLFLLFPTGDLADRRWRGTLWLWAVGAAVAIPGWALDPRLGDEFVGGVNPYARGGVPTGLLFGVGATLICAALMASVVAMILRLRRARGVEREQLKWVVFAATLVGVVLPTSAALWTVWTPIRLLAAVVLVLLPVGACVAILRHRLYDVDLVIARTVSYALIAVLLAAVYVTVTVAAAELVASPVAAAVAALIVAVTFRPVHDAMQSLADRWVQPARRRGIIAISQFVDALRRGDALVTDLEGTLRRTLHDDQFALVLELTDGAIVDTEGHETTPVALTAGRSEFRAATAAGATAVFCHREGDERLVIAVIAAGGLAIEIAALQVQLRRHLLEVEVSRRRIQSVADEERRRIARDLHDGAQQRLVAIGLALRHAQLRAEPQLGSAIDDAVAELAQSIDELREMAGGIRPGSLDNGLGVALRELAARSPIRLEVQIPHRRFPSHVETAAYFFACEAVTNAVKHADASKISLTVAEDDGSLVVTVVDDGRGGAEPCRGTGLVGLTDRISAHRGQLDIESPRGRGTRLEARLPCG